MWESKASKPLWERAGFAAGFHGGGTLHSPLRPRFSRGSSGGPGFVLPFAGGAETVGKPDTFPIELVNGAVMGEPVQQGCGQCGIAEDAGPLCKRQVRCDDQRTLFVAVREDLKQHLRPLGRERDIADFVHDEQLEAGQLGQAIAHALDLQRQGRKDDVIEKWRAIAQVAEGNDNDLAATAWFSVGYLLGDENQEESILANDKVIRLKPDMTEAQNNRGGAKYKLGQYDAAIADFDEAIRLKPDYAIAYHNRGEAKVKFGQNDAAIADFDDVIRLEPDHAIAHNNRGAAKCESGQYDTAVADYDEAIRLKPDYAIAYGDRGEAKAALGLNDGARKDLETALQLTRNANNAKIVAKAEQSLGDLDASCDS